MENTETMHVVICIDEKYAQHAAVTITSILYNKKSKMPIVFHIISDSLSLHVYNKLKQITDKYGASIYLYEVDSNHFEKLPVGHHISKATYYRLTVTDILPSAINKVLYLDVDLIVREDITSLWTTDISEYYAAAVQDIGIEQIDKKISLRAVLGMPVDEPYFNAGVLLMNATKWREESVNNKILTFIFSNIGKIAFADQDGLNAILWGKWIPINPKWNVYRTMFRKYYKWGKKCELTEEVLEAVKKPYVVHFTGGHKPWHRGCPIPYASEYYFYLSMTPWKDYKTPKATVQQCLKEYRWNLRKYIMNLLGL